MEALLYNHPWITYNNHFYKGRILLEYPKNIIFVAQFLKTHLDHHHHSTTGVYRKYPFAERFDVASFNRIDWQESVLVFDRDARLLVAPEPVQKLVNLDKRLRYKEAEDYIFGGFKFFPLEIFNFYTVLWIIVIGWFWQTLLHYTRLYRSSLANN